MKITREEFKEMRLRPALHNGEVFEATVEFNNSALRRVAISETDLLSAKPGDTVRIGGRIDFGDDTDGMEPVMIFMDSNRLTEFVERFGTGRITDTVQMKLMLRYAVYRERFDHAHRGEVVAFRLIELY